jgi:prepilin-type N-terminal cleavage/methylation domain-containing protein
MNASRKGFTLLEVIIALGILAGAMVVLVDSQAMAVLSSLEADRIITSTNLAQEKMVEVQLILERQGFGEMDIEEDGDFDDFGEEDFRGGDLHLNQEKGALKEFKWAYTVRKIELNFPTNLGDMAGDLAGNGYFGEEQGNQMDVGGTPDLGDMGISPTMVSDHLAGFIREVRVRVWWGDNEDETDQVELTTHIINPTGVVKEGGFSGLGAGGAM